MPRKNTIYHIPVCPFCQRTEILLALRGMSDAVDFEVVDITRPRDPALLAKTSGSTALPILETETGAIIKESLIILRYLDEKLPGSPLRQQDPANHATESMLVALEGPFTAAGYQYVMNQGRAQREAFRDRFLDIYRRMDAFLVSKNLDGPYLFDDFGLAEAVFTPLFQRFWFVEYYEDFELPDDPAYDRVRKWREACLSHPAASQVSREEIVKLYYDYALGQGNGALPEGRSVSSFTFSPHWRDRPWPPRDKWAGSASDAELGLVGSTV